MRGWRWPGCQALDPFAAEPDKGAGAEARQQAQASMSRRKGLVMACTFFHQLTRSSGISTLPLARSLLKVSFHRVAGQGIRVIHHPGRSCMRPGSRAWPCSPPAVVCRDPAVFLPGMAAPDVGDGEVAPLGQVSVRRSIMSVMDRSTQSRVRMSAPYSSYIRRTGSAARVCAGLRRRGVRVNPALDEVQHRGGLAAGTSSVISSVPPEGAGARS